MYFNFLRFSNAFYFELFGYICENLWLFEVKWVCVIYYKFKMQWHVMYRMWVAMQRFFKHFIKYVKKLMGKKEIKHIF